MGESQSLPGGIFNRFLTSRNDEDEQSEESKKLANLPEVKEKSITRGFKHGHQPGGGGSK